MEFGKVQNQQILERISWGLPVKDPQTFKHLQESATKQEKHKLWIGAPAWSHKEWVGKIYPEKTKPADYLKHYSKYFNTIELNTTHYRIPTPEQSRKWREQADISNFKFCPKIFNGISHERSGLTDKDLLKNWFLGIDGFKPNLGPCFLQLPPTFDYSSKTLLFKFLQQWPKEYRLAIEFRHPSWFQEGKVLPALSDYLHTLQIGLVILDVAGRRDLYHGSISSNFTMIRFIGNSLHSSDYDRAEIWNRQLTQWQEKGLQENFFFVHEPDDILIPEMTEHFKRQPYFKSNYELSTTAAELSGVSARNRDGQNLSLF